VTEFDFGFEHIDAISPEGEVFANWGSPGQFGSAAGPVPTDGFWGPRDVVLDSEGNVYVSDTGNKRVRVYTAQGEYLRDIGGAGTELGQLDEPAGLAISPDGRLFVADTWNRRISVFSLDGTPLTTFEVRGWYEDQGNRPYLAVDGARNLLYVGDPEAGRIQVYDLNGNCVGSFGQPAERVADFSQFQSVGGMTVDSAGNVLVVDSSAGRVLWFAPFMEGVAGAPVVEEQLPAEEVIIEVTPDADAGVFGVETTDEPAGDIRQPDLPLEQVTEEPSIPPETTDDNPDEATLEAVG
jgi:sugar lactone lactonase YvrE